MIRTVEWSDAGVVFIDQTKLPTEEVYVTCRTYVEMADAIRSMVIRGAPAIGNEGGFAKDCVLYHPKQRSFASPKGEIPVTFPSNHHRRVRLGLRHSPRSPHYSSATRPHFGLGIFSPSFRGFAD